MRMRKKGFGEQALRFQTPTPSHLNLSALLFLRSKACLQLRLLLQIWRFLNDFGLSWMLEKRKVRPSLAGTEVYCGKILFMCEYLDCPLKRHVQLRCK